MSASTPMARFADRRRDTFARPWKQGRIGVFKTAIVAGGWVLVSACTFVRREDLSSGASETGAAEPETISECIADSQGIDDIQDDYVAFVHGTDYVLLEGPCKVQIMINEGPRGGVKSASYSVKKLEPGQQFKVINEETSEWDVDIRINLI